MAWAGAAALAVALSGCGDDEEGAPVYEATVVRTTYGIPHVTANDWGSLGFGSGWAYAQDNYCVLMREVVRANGQSARWLPEGEANVADDFVYTFINTDAAIERDFLGRSPPELRALIRGYAAGLNHYLAETGVDALPEGPEGCRGADWVRPVTEVDLGKVYRKLIVRASTGALTSAIVDAEAPTETMASLAPPGLMSTPLDPAGIDVPPPEAMGSNAYAVGSEASQTGEAILLGNPHFPWTGSLRWYVSHMTIPGQFDVMGASLQGVPLVNIGFNENVAWTHTVSTGQRFTFYEIRLVEGDPMKYVYDGETREIEPHPVTIDVRLPDGTLEQRTETLYTSHYGPIVDLGGLNALLGGWPNFSGTVFTFRDANIDNARALEAFFALDRAESLDDVEAALRTIGLPWVNTIAIDRFGEALYADVTTVPNVSAEKLDDCADSFLAQTVTGFGRATLNGSRSECEWGTDPDGPPGLLGYDNLPKLRTRTYVANSNDSYWLSNPSQLLTGFSPLIGREGVEQSLRTRLAFVQAEERIAGADGLGEPGFTVDLVRELLYGNRDLAAELVRDEVVAICEGVEGWGAGDCGGSPYSAHPNDAPGACAVLEAWDGRFDADSVGAGLWNELWRVLRGTQGLWAVPFDPADPVGTPNTLAVNDADVVEAVRCALGDAVDFYLDRAVPLDRPWGEIQFRPVGDERIPIHGGAGRSTFSVISSRWVDGLGYADIFTGNSYIQAVTFDDTQCPDAWAVLTYSQSTNPASPHYADQTELYGAEGWNDMPFCPAAVEAATISEATVTNAP